MEDQKRETLDELKRHLTKLPALDLPRANGLYTVYIDASDLQIWGTFLQASDDKDFKPIGY